MPREGEKTSGKKSPAHGAGAQPATAFILHNKSVILDGKLRQAIPAGLPPCWLNLVVCGALPNFGAGNSCWTPKYPTANVELSKNWTVSLFRLIELIRLNFNFFSLNFWQGCIEIESNRFEQPNCILLYGLLNCPIGH